MRRSILAMIGLLSFACLSAQDKQKNRFEKIGVADFKVSSPVVDSNSNAVVLADVGSTEFVGNNNGDFSLVFKQHKRILLRNRNAFDEATVKIHVYTGTDFSTEERFEDFEATTYNIENGQVVATKLDKASLFKEKLTREQSLRKFTFPNIKEGSIIEYQYTIRSPFYSRLRPWYFQGEYPCLWSEYQVTIPPMFNYITNRQGYLKYTTDTVKRVYKNYYIVEQSGAGRNETYNLSGDATFALWAIKDVPAFKPEKYTSSPRNHINTIEFQLASIKYSETNTRLVLKDWFATTMGMMEDPDFGLQLKDDNGWIKDAMKKVTTDTGATERAKKIFEYVRDNFKCNDHEALWLSQPLKKTFQTKLGNVSDINILLTAIYINQGFEAQPVVLSTKNNGHAKEAAALLSQYNYVISRVKVDEQYLLLDASQNRMGFGKLPEDCYNISGRVIDPKLPVLVNLSPDSLKESKYTSIFIINDENGGGIDGSLTSNLGYIESSHLREKLLATKQEDYFKEIKKGYTPEFELSNLVVDSLKLYDEPVSVKYDLKLKFGDEDVIYFNPLFNEAWKKNPFTSAERVYPVEMPYQMNELFILDMEIPKGYKVDEIPKSTRMKLNDDDGMFEYIVSATKERVQLRNRLAMKKATFAPDDYETLREFFGQIVKKQAEQIVFKKIK
ncbi:MAG: transglutaminase domain-containing protein [Bacteroidota bacterium]